MSTAIPADVAVPNAGTARSESSARTAVAGARAVAPMIMAVLPLGVAIGATIATSSVPDLAGVVGGLLIFGGAAQLTTVEMLDGGAGAAIVIVSALLVNARVLMYGAAIGKWFRSETLPMRLLLALPLIDPLYFTAVGRFETGDLDRRGRRAFYLGAAVALAGSWLGVQTLAVVAGASLPEWLGLHLAAPLAFVGLLARSIPTSGAVLAASVAAAGAVLLVGLPLQSSVLVASLLAVAAGYLHHRRAASVADTIDADMPDLDTPDLDTPGEPS